MAATDNLGPQWFHGTYRKFAPGETIDPGHDKAVSNDVPQGHVYFSPSVHVAGDHAEWGASEHARGTGTPHVYKVEPTGEHEPDPYYQGARRSAAPLRITGEAKYDKEWGIWKP
jgi:rifampin ADP-ribosyltransferase